MQIQQETLSPSSAKLSVTADATALETIKKMVVKRLGSDVKVAGFRAGKAPENLIEKQIDPSILQSEFLNDAVNQLYDQAVKHEKLRVVAQPEITITKFVPFSTLEFTAQVEHIGPIKLADYKAIKLAPKKAEIKPAEVTAVLNNLADRAAEKKPVERAAKLKDEVTMDFSGVDAKTKERIEGADGQEYPLVIGSQSFIPGFEEELVGLKPGAKKTFDITFPKDYQAAMLQNRKVSFSVTILKVSELVRPKIDDKFAASVGPFKTLAELKADIKKQITVEKQREADQAYDNELLQKIADASQVAIPKALVDDEIKRLEEEEKRNIAYRGQTWQEHLDAEGVSEEEHSERQRPMAELRIKTGLLLGEISERENITVSPDELKTRIELLKNQYNDEALRAELDSPVGMRDINSRLMIEKTIDKIRSYSSKSK